MRWFLFPLILMVTTASTVSAQPIGFYGSTWGYGPTLRPWYGPWYGPGFGWGNPFVVPLAWSNGFWFPGFWWTHAQAIPLGPQPGAFHASGGYGIGGGLYGAQRDLPTVIPKAPPRFATRDVKRHYEAVIQQPQIAIQRQYQLRQRFGP
jgi:hypothetical protein